jgi:hypothetical protein
VHGSAGTFWAGLTPLSPQRDDGAAVARLLAAGADPNASVAGRAASAGHGTPLCAAAVAGLVQVGATTAKFVQGWPKLRDLAQHFD